MKKELECSIVQDLIPNYIEKLTSKETSQYVETHLNNCLGCKNIYEQMNTDIEASIDIPKVELKFIKKIKRTKMFAATLCIILTLLLSSLLYYSEYHYKIDKGDLSKAVTEFFTSAEPDFEAYVLETEMIGRTLIASFKDQSHPETYGIATFLKGVNQRYRIIKSQKKASDYSSVAMIFPVEIKKQYYYAINGYNLSDDIYSYSLDYGVYINPGNLSEDRVTKSIKFQVKNPQFLELYKADELAERVINESAEPLYDYYLMGTSLYDEEGNDITENFRNNNLDSKKEYGGGKAELFILYVNIAIIIGLGIIITRYFLTD